MWSKQHRYYDQEKNKVINSSSRVCSDITFLSSIRYLCQRKYILI